MILDLAHVKKGLHYSIRFSKEHVCMSYCVQKNSWCENLIQREMHVNIIFIS